MPAVQRLRAVYRDSGASGVARTVIQYARWRLKGSPPTLPSETPSMKEWHEAYGPLMPAMLDPGAGFSIVCPVFDTPPDILRRCVDSVLGQTHQNWELILVDDASTSSATTSELRAMEGRDTRIRVEFLEINAGIAGATNHGASFSTKSHLVFLDHDDLLAPTALSWLASAAEDADLIYTDEDKVDEEGDCHSPFFKPDWSPRLLLSVNYVNHITCVRRSLFDDVGGFRSGFDGVQDHDLLLRMTDTPGLRVVHVPNVLYHWRAWAESTSVRPASRSHVEERGVKVIQEALDRRGWAATAGLGNGMPFNYRPYFHPQREPPLVKIVMPTRDRLEILQRAVNGVLDRTDGVDVHLVIIDNGSQEHATLEYLANLTADHEQVDVVRVDDAFNYSRLCNEGAATGPETPFLLFLNNDIEVIHRRWLQQLAGWLENDDDIVAVGPKLLFPDRTIQHAGVIVGLGGLAGHYAGYLPDQPQLGNLHDQAREVGCLTAACLLVRSNAFSRVGGFREYLPIDFQDVDLCLRLRAELGGTLMYDPTYPLIHLQSASRGTLGAASSYTIARMKFLWGEELLRDDPYYSPHLSKGDHDFRLASIPADQLARLERLAPRASRSSSVRLRSFTTVVNAESGEAPHLAEELLWVPERCDARSAWLGHIPFGFWLVGALRPRVLVELGTHWGHSYFAFCQAIRDLGLPTKAFAVDTWAGDEHSGYYGEDVFVDVDNWNEQRFATFSTLLRSTFDAAAEGFDVSSIDLLHIDGLHTYDAVKHDFEKWLPKMSRRGVVLLHDITETRDDFGVHVLWSELEERYPTVGFEHSHGLGVVCVGDEIPDAIRALLSAQSTDHTMPRVFQALGERLELMARSENQAGLIEDLQVENEHRLRTDRRPPG